MSSVRLKTSAFGVKLHGEKADPGGVCLRGTGRFSSDLIENRRVGLQTALNKIVAHPMLVGDPDLRLFLESDTFDIDVSVRSISCKNSQLTTVVDKTDQAAEARGAS